MISGLSETPLASRRSRRAAWRSDVEAAPITCGWQRRRVGVLHAVVADGARRGWRCRPSACAGRRRQSIWPGWPRSAWMRASNGASEPLAASVRQRAGDQRGREQRSAPRTGRPARSAVETCVPLSSARPSLGPSVERRQADARQRLAPPAARRLRASDLADADQAAGQVRERRQIARRADRALARDHRQNVLRQQRHRSIAIGRRRTPESPRARLASLQRQHQPHDGVGHRLRRRRRMCESTRLRCSSARSAARDAHAARACRSRC